MATRSSTAIQCLFACLIGLPSAFAPAAEQYPSKPIRVIVPFAPGGGTDLIARTVSERMSESLGVGVIVDNRPGAGSTLGTTVAAQAPADGYTLLSTSASFIFSPSFYKDLPYHPVKSFRPITMLARTPMLLVVHPSMPVKNVRDLLSLAKRYPDEVRFGSSGVGSNLHLNTMLLANMAGIRISHVPYKGAGPAQVALISGEIQALLTGIQAAMPLVRAGRMRVLAVSTKERMPIVPHVPTIHEVGVPGFDSAGWFGVFGPTGIGDAVVSRVHQAAVQAVRHPAVVKNLAAEGSLSVGSNPSEFAAFVRDDFEKWSRVIRELKP